MERMEPKGYSSFRNFDRDLAEERKEKRQEIRKKNKSHKLE
jgi:hypothetical protein